jgi:hypothetical protein
MPQVTPVREDPPTNVHDKILLEFIDVVYNHIGPPTSENDELLFANVGLDFGTSSTKVIIRLPYEPGSPAIVIPAPLHCRSSNDPYLWQTVLWVQPDGEFLPWPESGSSPLHTLKQVLIDRVSNPDGLEAATAYLSYVIRHAKGWLRSFRPNVVRNRRLFWTCNIGIPVATLNDTHLSKKYRRIAAAAYALGDLKCDITKISCKAALGSPTVLQASDNPAFCSELGVSVIPEAAAEATGYVKSSNSAEGDYLMIDIGALTLDACIFGFRNGKFHFYTADVRPLGVESFHWFKKIGKTLEDFELQCNRCLWSVVWGARRDFIQNATCWQRGYDLPTFILGGGAANQEHSKVVLTLTPWLKRHTKNEGIRSIKLPQPAGLDLPYPMSDFGRLAVAWGLSFPSNEIGEFSLPTQIEKTPALQIAEERGLISKDQV